jgi:hypothetical protein
MAPLSGSIKGGSGRVLATPEFAKKLAGLKKALMTLGQVRPMEGFT